MYCSKCGNKMQVGEMFCGNCGTPRKGLVTEPAAPVQVNPVTAEVAASTDTNKEPAQTTPATAATPSPATPAAKKKPPKKALIIIPVLLALIAIGIFVYLHFFTYRSVKIEEYNGNVELERNGSEKDLFEGLKLIPKDTVTTGEDGLIELFIDSDKHVVAEANTCFSVNAVGNENSGKVTIDLEYGSTLITIDEKLAEDSEFEVETPNCLCSVRGTTFHVSYDEPNLTTRVDVTVGTVRVKAGDIKLDVNAGESVVIKDKTVYKVKNVNGTETLELYTGDGDTGGFNTNGTNQYHADEMQEIILYVRYNDYSSYENIFFQILNINDAYLHFCSCDLIENDHPLVGYEFGFHDGQQIMNLPEDSAKRTNAIFESLYSSTFEPNMDIIDGSFSELAQIAADEKDSNNTTTIDITDKMPRTLSFEIDGNPYVIDVVEYSASGFSYHTAGPDAFAPVFTDDETGWDYFLDGIRVTATVPAEQLSPLCDYLNSVADEATELR